MRARGILGRSKRWIGGSIHRFLFENDYLRDEYFTTSYMVPQRLLLCIRVVLFFYCLAVLATNLSINIVHEAGWSWAVYFTTLTYIGIAMYYWFAAYNTARCLLKHRRVSRGSVAGRTISHPTPLPPDQLVLLAAASNRVFGTPASLVPVDGRAGYRETGLDRVRLLRLDTYHANESQTNSEVSETVQDMSPLGDISVHSEVDITASTKISEQPARSAAHQLSLATQWILYELFACYAPLVSIIYWSILFPTQPAMDTAADMWTSVSMHALNTVLMGLEVLVFARSPFRWTHVSVALSAMLVYLGLVYMMVGLYDFYVYPFFSVQYFGAGGVAVFCVLLLDVAAISWVVLLMIHHWRDKAYPRKWPPVQCTPIAA
ncbi:hypothetical protein GGH94_003765 [Coemansia aciculifera]|uniref:Uncharacterized protein n=1 Tax=Coemansia aciculifera TaxID=417176 RepID=A0A9W8IIV1_9FUNG|nr:hypothetical protein GGH94_003765 [Coemansia aciculifera]KAJ2872833.1 hypothetical protein GGH93_003689 [Coemansia aciculifera]